MTEQNKRRQDDGHEGLCPLCRNADGYINVGHELGHEHWFFCDMHKTKWCIGVNLYSLAPFETEDYLRKQYEAKGFDDYDEVGPVFPPRGPDGRFVPEPGSEPYVFPVEDEATQQRRRIEDWRSGERLLLSDSPVDEGPEPAFVEHVRKIRQELERDGLINPVRQPNGDIGYVATPRGMLADMPDDSRKH